MGYGSNEFNVQSPTADWQYSAAHAETPTRTIWLTCPPS
jgi:hypothetical protein